MIAICFKKGTTLISVQLDFYFTVLYYAVDICFYRTFYNKSFFCLIIQSPDEICRGHHRIWATCREERRT